MNICGFESLQQKAASNGLPTREHEEVRRRATSYLFFHFFGHELRAHAHFRQCAIPRARTHTHSHIHAHMGISAIDDLNLLRCSTVVFQSYLRLRSEFSFPIVLSSPLFLSLTPSFSLSCLVGFANTLGVLSVVSLNLA